MGIKLKLLKNISINLLNILLAYISLTYVYSTLFLNEKQLLLWLINIFAKYVIVFFLLINSAAYSLILLSNLINLDLL